VSVFGRKNDMVIAEVDAVACSSVVYWLGHALMVSERGAG
jgi:hypothetical protein